MFLSGVDGDGEALDLIRAGGAYKLSIAFAWTLMGYGLGQFGADWIEGKEVPQIVVARPGSRRVPMRKHTQRSAWTGREGAAYAGVLSPSAPTAKK